MKSCLLYTSSDLDKAEKIILINELLCEFDEKGNPKLTPEQKKLFVFTGEKLPEEKGMIQEYNPEIRIEQITKAFELALSLLSMSFGYGTKKYNFENAQITTATQYAVSYTHLRYPDQIKPFVDAEIKLAHRWTQKKGLEELWEQCQDIDDVSDITNL